MEKNYGAYNFKGTTEEIINHILSLLLGKELYNEISLYSNFLNDKQPARYQKKIKDILDQMQKENLILIRGNNEIGAPLPLNNENVDKTKPDLSHLNHLADARVYLRQHGKEILSEGGYKKSQGRLKYAEKILSERVPLTSKLLIALILIAALLYII